MPEVQFISLVERVNYNRTRFKNYIETAPHSKFNPTACPGKYFPMDRLLQAISSEYKMVNGAFAKNIILQFVAMFKIVQTFKDACSVLQSMNIISSPDYWVKTVMVKYELII